MQQSPAPEHVIVTPVGQADIVRSNKVKLRWGLICLIAPTALFILSIFGYMILNFMTGDSTSPLRTISNVLLFLVGAIVVLTWLPGIVIGIILLATRKKVS